MFALKETYLNKYAKHRTMAKFIMVEGLDGSGKGVVVNALRDWALEKDLKVLDLREYWKENEGFPNITEFDVILSAEPTFTGWGKKIRTELIKNRSTATTEEIAEAFAKDRKELYEKIIIPAIKQDKYIFQERGLVTSLVYQNLQGLELNTIMNLDGNKFCLEHPPDILILTIVDPEVVIKRLDKREKRDDAIFEKLDFQKKAKQGYESDWLKKIFEDKGTKVIYLNTNPPSTPKDTKNKAIEIIESN